MFAKNVFNVGWIIVFFLFLMANSCSFSDKEVKLLLMYDASSSYMAKHLNALCREKGYTLHKTTELTICSEDSLKGYHAIILDIPVDTLNNQQQTDLERYVLAGGGLLGINVHTNFIHKWPWMENLLESEFGPRYQSDSFEILNVAKKANLIDGITKTVGPGRVCVLYTHNLSALHENLVNAISYAIEDDESGLHYDEVAVPRVPSAGPFSERILVDHLSEPVDMEVLPQGDLIIIERRGAVKYFNTQNQKIKQIANFDVNHKNGFGLTSIALDPNFEKNHWVYFGYTPHADPQHQYISRFFLAEDSLIQYTEKVLARLSSDHAAISMLALDEEQHFFVGISDYPMHNENEVEDDMGIPDNTLHNDQGFTRQNRIYRLSLGPDTTLELSLKAQNIDSVNLKATHSFNTAQAIQPITSGQIQFKNWGGIGITQDGVQWRQQFPYLQSGNYLISGPIYRYDQFSTSGNKLPDFYGGKLFLVDAENKKLLTASFGTNQQLHAIEPVLPLALDNPVRLKFAPDGSLYILEHGPTGFISHKNARLRHITYAQENRPPVAKISADTKTGQSPLTINFSAEGSFDYDDKDTLSYEWYFQDTVIHTGAAHQLAYEFHEPGIYHPLVKVKDQYGDFAEATTRINVGNTKPEVFINTTINRSFYWKSTDIPYKIKITDIEDGEIDPASHAKIKLFVHARDQIIDPEQGLLLPAEGNLVTQKYDKDSLIDYTLVVEVKDRPVNGLPANEVHKTFTLRAPQLFATDSDLRAGVLDRTDQKSLFVQNGGYLTFNDIDMRGINHLKYRVKPNVDGFLELRLNAPNGPVVGTLRMKSRETWATFTVRIGQIEGNYDLYFVFRQSEDEPVLANHKVLCMLEWIYFGREKIGWFYRSPDANDLL